MIGRLITLLTKRSSSGKAHVSPAPDTRLDRAIFKNDLQKSLPPADPAKLIAMNKDLIDQAYRHLGLSEYEFNRYYVSVVCSFAEYVQLLPASEKHHHNGVGGLFRHSLEVGTAAARFTLGKSFCGGLAGDIRVRSKVRWPVAVTIAAMLHDIGKAIYDIKVVGATSGDEWRPFKCSLYEFAQREEYFASWRGTRTHKMHEMAGVSLINKVVSADVLDWLNQGDPQIIPTMISGIAGIEVSEQPSLHEIVVKADRESVSAYQSYGEAIRIELPASESVHPAAVAAQQQIATDEPKALPDGAMGTSGNAKRIVITPSSEQLLKVLPEAFAAGDVVVNIRDRERGLFWVDESSGTAWATWPQLYNAAVSLFEKEAFTAYPKNPGQFFDMLEIAGVVQKIEGEYAINSSIKPENGRAFKLKLARLASSNLMDLLKRYKTQLVEIKPEILGIALSDSELVIPPTKVIANTEIAKSELNASEEGRRVTADRTEEVPDEAVSDDPSVCAQLDAKADQKSARSSGEEKNTPPDDNGRISSSGIVDGSELGDLLDEIGSAIKSRRLATEYTHLIDGCICLNWPASAGFLGEDADDVVLHLTQGRKLAKRSDSEKIEVKPSGVSRVKVGKKTITVLAISKPVSSALIRQYSLFSDGNLELDQTNVSREVSVSSTAVTDPNSNSIKPSRGKSDRTANSSGTLKANKDDDVDEQSSETKEASSEVKNDDPPKQRQAESRLILNAIDNFLSSNYGDYSSRVSLVGKMVQVNGFPEVYLKASSAMPSIPAAKLNLFLQSEFIEKRQRGSVFFMKKNLPNLMGKISNDAK